MRRQIKPIFGLRADLSFVWRGIVIAGVVLRLRQYIADRSLWYDEAALALNIVGRGFGGLLQPLDNNQAAPPGFLFIEKLILLAFGNRDYILRLFPLLSGVAAVYLLYLTSKEYLGKPGLFALSLSVVAWPLIYYSTDVKQYSSDVLVSIALTLLAFRALRKGGRRNYIVLAAAGVISTWLSHPAVFTLASIGLALAVEALMRRDFSLFARILGLGALWLANFGLFYVVSAQQAVNDPYMLNYWQAYFMPLPPWRRLDWFRNAYFNLLAATTYVNGWPPQFFVAISSLLLAAGVVSFFASDRNIALTMTLPFFFVLSAAALQKYPIYGRFILFLLPFLFIFMAKGLELVYSFLARLNRPASLLVCGGIALAVLWVPAEVSLQYFRSPYMSEHIKPAMAYISQQSLPGDVIYVYYGSRFAFEYYAPSFDLSNDRIIFGVASRSDPAQYIVDIKQLQGVPRVWLVFSHICPSCAVNEQDFYLRHLDQIGARKGRFRFPGVTVYLYDFSR